MALLNSLSTPLRIALVTNNYTPYCGGVVSSINTLADGLQKQGHRVYIITLEFLNNHSDDPEHVIRLPSPIRFMYKQNHMALPWRPTAQLKKIFIEKSINIVHTHHPFLLGIAALRAAQLCRVPTIFTYHTLYAAYTHYVPFFQRITKEAITQRVTRYCNDVNHIIAPSTSIKDRIQLSRSAPVSVIPSAINTSFFHHEPPNKHLNSPMQLLCVSRFVPEKNLTTLFDLCKDLGDAFHVTLAGYGQLENYLRWYATIKLRIPSKNITFKTSSTQQELGKLYSTSHLFVFTSTTDTQGLVLAEAMAGGTPVIALDGPGQRDMVINGYNGFLCTTQKEMQQHISTIASNSLLYDTLCKGAYNTAKRYTSDSFVQNITKVYRSSLLTCY